MKAIKLQRLAWVSKEDTNIFVHVTIDSTENGHAVSLELTRDEPSIEMLIELDQCVILSDLPPVNVRSDAFAEAAEGRWCDADTVFDRFVAVHITQVSRLTIALEEALEDCEAGIVPTVLFTVATQSNKWVSEARVPLHTLSPHSRPPQKARISSPIIVGVLYSLLEAALLHSNHMNYHLFAPTILALSLIGAGCSNNQPSVTAQPIPAPVVTPAPAPVVPTYPEGALPVRPRPAHTICDLNNHICVSDTIINKEFATHVSVTGTAIAFENQFYWEARNASGTALFSGTLMAASPDIGQPGPFTLNAVTPVATSTHVTLRFYEAFAKDGSPINILDIPVTLK